MCIFQNFLNYRNLAYFYQITELQTGLDRKISFFKLKFDSSNDILLFGTVNKDIEIKYNYTKKKLV
ncbi:MAG: hypothetical protein CM15mP124_4250 [Alphaproteobacteria bacterium]|nr:MAG: hypothetical protein CM15mP124_4250 [Alphaproteobacteria bacterium]